MRNLLKEGSDWLQDQQVAYCATFLSYRRSSYSVSLAATKGRSTHAITDSQGFLINEESDDFLIAAADLIINGSAVEPAAGDWIVEGSSGSTYEVTGVAGGPAWRWADSYRKRYRIHVKYLAATPPS